MAIGFSKSLTFVITSAFVASGNAWRLAPRVEQQLEGRSTYLGGWPLAATICPADAPVSCGTNDGTVNPTCCPSGNTCFGLTAPYCCPTTTDCQAQVSNLPVCANSTWNMFGQDDNSKYFCCESGQIGVDPLSGYAGICEAADQVVPVSLRATMVSQIGGTPVPPFGSYVTGAAAASSSDSNPASTTAEGATATKGAGATGTKGSTYASSTSSASGSGAAVTSAIKLSLGAIIGIAVGGFFVVLILLSLAIWCCCCRGRHRRSNSNIAQEPYTNTYAEPMPNNAMYGAPPPQQMYGAAPMPYQNAPYDPVMNRGMSPGTEYKTLSPDVGGQYTGVTEVPGDSHTYGRSEM